MSEILRKLQAGGSLRQSNKPIVADNTSVTYSRIIPETVDDNEVIRDYEKYQTNPEIRAAFKKQLMKYGNPSMGYNTFDLGTDGRYNAFTNDIGISKKFKNSHRLKNIIFEELAHAKQRQDQGALLLTGKAVVGLIKSPFKDIYETPGEVEYDAHKVVSPKILNDYNKDLELMYVPKPDEYDIDDPDAPIRKPSLLQKLKINNKTNKLQSGGILNSAYEKVKSVVNPKNWGVPDYSEQGNYNRAFDAARKANEPEFMWNDKRYTTKTQFTPQQQMVKYGLPDDQVIGSGFIRDRWAKNISPDPSALGVSGSAAVPLNATILGGLGLFMGEGSKNTENEMKGYNMSDAVFTNKMNTLPSKFIQEKSSKYKTMTPEAAKADYTKYKQDVRKYGSQIEDIYQMYLGKPQKYNSVAISNYKPNLAKDKKDFYYALPKISQDSTLIRNLYDSMKNYSGPADANNPKIGDIVGRGKKNFNAMLPSLGTAITGIGEDEKGKYVSYYDDWDVTITGGSGSGGKDSTMGIGKPMSFYDRVYVDANGNPIKSIKKND